MHTRFATHPMPRMVKHLPQLTTSLTLRLSTINELIKPSSVLQGNQFSEFRQESVLECKRKKAKIDKIGKKAIFSIVKHVLLLLGLCSKIKQGPISVPTMSGVVANLQT